MVKVFDGKAHAKSIINAFDLSIPLKLVIILVGDDSVSSLYVSKKQQMCKKLGIECDVRKFSSNIKEEDLIFAIHEANEDGNVTGIIIQLPLPKYIDAENVGAAIADSKDVDGFGSNSTSSIYFNHEELVPCTPKGIIRILDMMGVDVGGKHVVVVGRSYIVGKPLALMLLNRNATVTICHSKTQNLGGIVKSADVVIAAVGHPDLITSVKDGAVVIDVGTTHVNGKVVGDVVAEKVQNASWLTPVPGGVGPMTIAMIIENLIKCYNLQKGGIDVCC